MEDGLRGTMYEIEIDLDNGLNPCSCGGWSQRRSRHFQCYDNHNVLILVLVEDGLRDHYYATVYLKDGYVSCLNPCSCGGWSQRLLRV